jgi:hypothetical protein
VGLGKEAPRHYTLMDVRKLIFAVRSFSKGEAAREDIARTTGHTDI